jgi:hypothetical protein
MIHIEQMVRQRCNARSAISLLCLAAAIGIGIYASYVDHHNASEVYPTLMVAMAGSLVMGLIRLAAAWRWALIIGLAVPFAGPVITLPARLTVAGNWAIVAIVSTVGLLGAYSGSALRRAVGALR